tara:strand:+ start:109 stop:828 length:720 start_codon:yes stop_codon:yes gene_type:complete
MTRKKILVCGKGKWGKKVIKQLKKLSNTIKIIDTKTYFKKIDLTDIDWVFVLTPNNTHFRLVSYFLSKKKNVFCEKPLTQSLLKTKYLVKLAKTNKCKLYISDIEIYKNKRIKKTKKLYVVRKKYSSGSTKEILYRLAYHDIYLLENYLRPIDSIKILKIEKKNRLELKLEQKKISVFFDYDLNSKIKKHCINNQNFLHFRGNPLNKMVFKILNNRVNFIKNQNTAVFCNKLINKILKS